MKDVTIGAIVAMPIKGIINCYLVGFQACSTQGNSHPVLLISSRPHAWPGRSQALDGPTTVILLYEHVTLASKHLCFYLQIGAVPSLGQRRASATGCG